MTELVHQIFMAANPTGYKLDQVNFTEVTLTGNQLYSQAMAQKTKWRLNVTQKLEYPRHMLSDDVNAISLP